MGQEVTGTERKRAWRLANPERSRAAERDRAQARRDGHYGIGLGVAPRLCAGHDSYWRYEYTTKRFMQRTFWPRYGAGTTTMTQEEFRATGDNVMADMAAEFRRIETLTPEEIAAENAAFWADPLASLAALGAKET